MHHNFDVEIATKYGIGIAVFLNNMAFWIQKNIANNKHFHDEKFWTYNSVKAYGVLFPYFTPKQLRKIIDDCVKKKLIIKGNYNDSKYDKTSWYAFTDLGLETVKLLNCPNGQRALPTSANGDGSEGEPIPDTKPDIKPNKKTVTDISKKPKKEKQKDQKKKQVIDKTFYPDYKNQKLADHVADKCGTSGAWLIKRFIEITLESGRKEYDFNDLFSQFLEKQRPVKERRDFKGASQVSKYI